MWINPDKSESPVDAAALQHDLIKMTEDKDFKYHTLKAFKERLLEVQSDPDPEYLDVIRTTKEMASSIEEINPKLGDALEMVMQMTLDKKTIRLMKVRESGFNDYSMQRASHLDRELAHKADRSFHPVVR